MVKIQIAIIRKSIILWIKAPYSIFVSLNVKDKLEKSTPPKTKPKIGVKILLTRLVTIDEKAPPTIIFSRQLPPLCLTSLFYHI